MIPLRRVLGVAVLMALATLAASVLGSCSKNDLMGQGLDRSIVPIGAGPKGVFGNPDSTWKWAVNSIDSVIFTDNIDSTTLEVTGFQLLDSLGRRIPGTVRFMPSNAYIHYNQPFPDASFDFFVSNPPAASSIGKVYYVPAQPLSGHTTYTYELTTGVRMVSGRFKRDVWQWSFTTGDSVAPPNPVWP